MLRVVTEPNERPGVASVWVPTLIGPASTVLYPSLLEAYAW